jgi:two-component system KDP operon response regulator KdpE
MDELVARLRAALRRDSRPGGGPEFSIGTCLVNLSARTVIRKGCGEPEPVHLTKTEWRMLDVLLRSSGQLVPASRLLAELWGPGAENSTHYLRFHMAGLRRKLEDDPPRPRHLLTEPGMGYRYQP